MFPNKYTYISVVEIPGPDHQYYNNVADEANREGQEDIGNINMLNLQFCRK